MRFLLLSACISTSPSLLADIFHPSLIPVKNCIQARLIYGEEIIRYSKEPPFIVYFNGAGKDIETTLSAFEVIREKLVNGTYKKIAEATKVDMDA